MKLLLYCRPHNKTRDVKAESVEDVCRCGDCRTGVSAPADDDRRQAKIRRVPRCLRNTPWNFNPR